MFQTNTLWEHSSSVYERDTARSRSTAYVMVEVPIKASIFHVDLLMRSDGKEEAWKRYLVSSLAIVLEILGDSRVANCRVAIQTFSEGLNSYKIDRIDEILSFEDIEGFTNLVYRYSDGTDHLDGAGPIENKTKVEMLSLWKSKREGKGFLDAESTKL